MAEDSMPEKDGKIPTIHIKAKSIPEAYFKALCAVHYNGYEIRTQYDRKDSNGYIDPPSRDAKVMIGIEDPFAEPRFPILSFCERGKYIAEFLGAKDHLVVPYKQLLEMVNKGEKFETTQWPYTYPQRLTKYPKSDGTTMNQLEMILDTLAQDSISRRAIAITGVPEIDSFMKSDQPCLREIQMRAPENDKGELVLNMHAAWRSRDLYKAWGDNMIGISNLHRKLALRLSEKTGKKVIVGPYTEVNGSLHIYGQDYSTKGAADFFEKFKTPQSFIDKAWTSEKVRDCEIIPQLKEFKNETTWRFTPESIAIIDGLINDFESGGMLP